MAFVETDLGAVAHGVSDDKPFTLWIYKTTADTIAAIKADADYFALAAENSGVFEEGERRIKNGDLIIVTDSANATDILVVTDQAAGTAATSFGAAA